MKAVVHFDLSNEEDKYSYDSCSQADKMRMFISELKSAIRSKIKYNEVDGEVYEKFREMFCEVMADNDLTPSLFD